jgi:hypothetical protein
LCFQGVFVVALAGLVSVFEAREEAVESFICRFSSPHMVLFVEAGGVAVS